MTAIREQQRILPPGRGGRMRLNKIEHTMKCTKCLLHHEECDGDAWIVYWSRPNQVFAVHTMTLTDRVLYGRLFDIEVLTSSLIYQKLRDQSFHQHSLFIAFHRDAGAPDDEGWHCIPGVQKLQKRSYYQPLRISIPCSSHSIATPARRAR